MTNTTLAAHLDVNGERFDERAPQGPCRGEVRECLGLGPRVLDPYELEMGNLVDATWVYLCPPCFDMRRLDA